MKFAFIVNHYKTIFFYELAVKLAARGHQIFWLSPSHHWTNWLLDKGVARDSILDITRYGAEWVEKSKAGLSGEEVKELAEMEGQNDNWRLNDLILMDRLLRQKSFAYAQAYLLVTRKYMRKFLSQHGIEAVFGEKTWAFELLATQVCKELGIHSYNPQSVSIPDGKFAFFEGYLQAEVPQIAEPGVEDHEFAERFYREFVEKRPKPRYWHLNNIVPTVQANWVGKFFKNFRLRLSDAYTYDETMFTIPQLIRMRVGQAKNSRDISRRKPFTTPEQINKPFVLYALHKQPEASIDVLGSFYSNQLELIKRISRLIPATHDLYVKEHRNSIGDSPIEFYQQLKEIPAVQLIDPFVDSHQLINKADLVISVSGTVAYEAALYGVPSVTLSKMYFGRILCADGLVLDTADLLKIMGEREKCKSKGAEVLDFLAFLNANLFDGIISDPVSDMKCMEDENLTKVADAFDRFADYLAKL